VVLNSTPLPKQSMIPSSMSKFPASNDRSQRCAFFNGATVGECPEAGHLLCSALESTRRSDSRQFTLVYGCLRISPRECKIVQFSATVRGPKRGVPGAT
jgi:hypothetical protein